MPFSVIFHYCHTTDVSQRACRPATPRPPPPPPGQPCLAVSWECHAASAWKPGASRLPRHQDGQAAAAAARHASPPRLSQSSSPLAAASPVALSFAFFFFASSSQPPSQSRMPPRLLSFRAGIFLTPCLPLRPCRAMPQTGLPRRRLFSARRACLPL